jgi:hypothetical protein
MLCCKSCEVGKMIFTDLLRGWSDVQRAGWSFHDMYCLHGGSCVFPRFRFLEIIGRHLITISGLCSRPYPIFPNSCIISISLLSNFPDFTVG